MTHLEEDILYDNAKDAAFRMDLSYSSKEGAFASGVIWLAEWLEALTDMATAIKARYGYKPCALCSDTGLIETGTYDYPAICSCGALGRAR